MEENNETTIMQVDTNEIVHAQEKAQCDIQVSTARKFPRDIKKARDNSIAIATMDKDTAQSCGYSLPRGGKTISGASVHLARILAQNWGNIRAEAKIVETTHNQIVSRAVAWDLENNYAISVEVRRKITDKNGKRYNEDLITVTGNAANAIAYRNAVFAVIPKSIIDAAYKATRNEITGDLSDEEKLIKKRKAVLDGFRDTYGVTEGQILRLYNFNKVNQIKQNELVELIGLAQALKDGDTTVEDTFGNLKHSTKTPDVDESKKKTDQIAEQLKTQTKENKETMKESKPKIKQSNKLKPIEDKNKFNITITELGNKKERDYFEEVVEMAREMDEKGLTEDKIQKILKQQKSEYKSRDQLLSKGSLSYINKILNLA